MWDNFEKIAKNQGAYQIKRKFNENANIALFLKISKFCNVGDQKVGGKFNKISKIHMAYQIKVDLN